VSLGCVPWGGTAKLVVPPDCGRKSPKIYPDHADAKFQSLIPTAVLVWEPLISSRSMIFKALSIVPDITVHSPGTGSFSGEERGDLASARTLIRCLIRKDVPVPLSWL
jgi:hypothetical protein